MRKIDNILEVEEILNIIDVGITVPVRCRLENGMNVVVKYMKNPFGQQVLVNEWIGSSIADAMALTIPEYGVCNLSEEVILNTNSNEEIDERNSGLAFYSKDYSSTVPPMRQMLSFVKNKETEKIILFDHIVNNCDRHNGNFLLDMSKAILYSIDNSHIITERIGIMSEKELERETILSCRVMEKNQEVYDLLCSGIGYSEERMLEEAKQIRKNLSQKVLNDIMKTIPAVWIESIGKDILSKMFEVISKRVASIGEIAEMIVEERRRR